MNFGKRRNTQQQYTTGDAPRTSNTEKLATSIADQATKIKDLGKLMDDAEGARTGSDSGVALILRDIALALYELALRAGSERVLILAA